MKNYLKTARLASRPNTQKSGLPRNPVRAEEIARARRDKQARVERLLNVAKTGDRAATRRALVEVVPTYRIADPPMIEPMEQTIDS